MSVRVRLFFSPLTPKGSQIQNTSHLHRDPQKPQYVDLSFF